MKLLKQNLEKLNLKVTVHPKVKGLFYIEGRPFKMKQSTLDHIRKVGIYNSFLKSLIDQVKVGVISGKFNGQELEDQDLKIFD